MLPLGLTTNPLCSICCANQGDVTLCGRPKVTRGEARSPGCGDTMRTLRLHRDQPVHDLAADLRRAFSGIVSGNVKEQGIRAIERHGPFELVGDPAIMTMLDELLSAFVAQQRMKLPGTAYVPCCRVVRP